MKPEKYKVFPVGITRDGKWCLCENDPEAIRSGAWETQADLLCACLLPDAGIHGLCIFEEGSENRLERIDCVLPILHGIGGEDGTVQGLCRLAGIPCVGCSVVSSAICMDKAFAKAVAAQAGIAQAKWLVISPEDHRDDAEIVSLVEDRFEYPVFVKPANAGSSVGISKAKTRDELLEAISDASKVDKKVLIEETIIGQEVEVAVLGNLDPIASGVGEIAPADGFYSYSGKYEDNTTKLFIPARLEEKTANRVREEALRAYKALGCSGFARVDFFVTPKQKVILNEINTIPGFTPISMYPKLMEADGIEFDELVDRLIELALEQDED